MAKTTKTKRQRVYRVITEGTAVIECEARCSPSGNWTIREIGGWRGWKLEPYWFQMYFGTTPEEAIEKFIARQQVRLYHLHHEIEGVERQLALATALRERSQHRSREGRPANGEEEATSVEGVHQPVEPAAVPALGHLAQ